MQKVLSFKDATVTVTAGMFGPIQITVECRSYRATLTPDEFAQLVYPSIDAAATAQEKTT